MRLVSMSVNDRRKSRRLGLQIQLIENMQHIYGNTFHLENIRLRQLSRPDSAVHIAADCGHWSNFAQLIKNAWIADISGMNDEIGASQRR